MSINSLSCAAGWVCASIGLLAPNSRTEGGITGSLSFFCDKQALSLTSVAETAIYPREFQKILPCASAGTVSHACVHRLMSQASLQFHYILGEMSHHQPSMGPAHDVIALTGRSTMIPAHRLPHPVLRLLSAAHHDACTTDLFRSVFAGHDCSSSPQLRRR